MKDFLYLDTDAISNISAQLFEGNTLEYMYTISKLSEDSITDTIQNKAGESIKGAAKAPIASIDVSKSKDVLDTKTFNWKNGNTKNKSTKKAYDDFLYNRVYDELINKELIKEISASNQFDIVKFSGKFNFIDMATISNIFDTDLLMRIPFLDTNEFNLPELKELNDKFKKSKLIFNPKKENIPGFKNRQEAETFYNVMKNMKVLEVLKLIASHLNVALKDKIILEQNNNIIIGDKKYLRIPSEILTVTGQINIAGTGRVISDPHEKVTVEEVTEFNIDELKGEPILSIGTKAFLLLFLQLVLDLNTKDTFKLIHPIGLELFKSA